MDTKTEFKILNCIGQIYEEAKGSKLKAEFFKKIDTKLIDLSTYFGTTKTQSFFIAMVFSLNYKGDTVDYNDLISYFKCNPMKLLEFNDEFKYLEDNHFFKTEKTTYRVKVSRANDQFTVNEKISEAILNKKPMPKIASEVKDIFELLEDIFNLCVRREEGEITTHQLFSNTKRLLDSHPDFQLIKNIKKFNLNSEDTLLYMYVIWKTIAGREQCDLMLISEAIFDRATHKVRYQQGFLKGDNSLLQHKLVELQPAAFFGDAQIKLSKASNEILKACDISVFTKTKNKDNLITPSKIATKKLIFNPTEMKQLYMMKDLLKPEQFKNTVERLEEKNLPKGITVLLHGAPGTGKTEVVKQIAKETNRELMKVDISQTKSMWFGESEKKIKKIFTAYKSLMEESDNTPILFFNEADAIISKRGDVGGSNSRQTENAIQNIILEELENFEGIVIATTNLPRNLDSAFERRFLFKIEFKRPDIEIRSKIWQSKLKFLSLDQCSLLAREYDFSGGQIDNIVRKTEIQEIIHGKDVNFDSIKAFCAEETLTDKRIEIGFGK